MKKYIDFIKENLPMVNDLQAKGILEKCNYRHDSELEVKQQILFEISKTVKCKEIQK